jgi:hypothetical protein
MLARLKQGMIQIQITIILIQIQITIILIQNRSIIMKSTRHPKLRAAIKDRSDKHKAAWSKDGLSVIFDYDENGVNVYAKYKIEQSLIDNVERVYRSDNRYGCLPLRLVPICDDCLERGTEVDCPYDGALAKGSRKLKVVLCEQHYDERLLET